MSASWLWTALGTSSSRCYTGTCPASLHLLLFGRGQKAVQGLAGRYQFHARLKDDPSKQVYEEGMASLAAPPRGAGSSGNHWQLTSMKDAFT